MRRVQVIIINVAQKEYKSFSSSRYRNMLMRVKMEDLPPLSPLIGSTYLGTKTLWKINQPSDLFLKNPVNKGNSPGLLQSDVNLVKLSIADLLTGKLLPRILKGWM